MPARDPHPSVQTERLYYADPLLVAFEAEVVATPEVSGRRAVVLDRTAFYPESGGQLADRGELGGHRVTDVQTSDEGLLLHTIEGDAPSVGTRVQGLIDLPRRRVHMALHTGQHILSKALLDVARAETVSARLGENACTIDVDAAALDEKAIAAAEALANAVIDDDVVIRSYFPDPEELAALPLRREPKVNDHVRVIQIGDFDVTPCGGTHCLRSAQVGLIHIVGVERYKGGTRVSFGAGRRARDQLVGESLMLHALGQQLSSGVHDVPNAIEKLRRELTAARESLGQARARLAAQAAEDLIRRAKGEAQTTVVAEVDGAGVELLRAVAKRLNDEVPTAVALLAGSDDDGLPIVISRGAASSFDCGAFLKRAATEAKGRGGGRPERAEGRMPAGVAWQKLVQSLLGGS